MTLFLSQTFGKIYAMPKSSLKTLKNIGFALLLLVLSANFAKNTYQVMQNDTRFEELRAYVDSLKQQKVQDAAELRYKQTPDYIEQEARIKLNLIKPNERIFVVSESLAQGSTAVLGENISTKVIEGFETNKQSNLSAWLSLVL